MGRRAAVCGLLVVLITPSSAFLRTATAGMNAPPSQAELQRNAKIHSQGSPAPHRIVLGWAFYFYSDILRPARGGRCPMYPSCSQYSRLALRNHGLVGGLLRTGDRLTRCGADGHLYPLALTDQGLYRLDPVR